MTCITDAALEQLRKDGTFKDWILKLKDAHPDKSDEEIEKTLVLFMNANNGNFPGYTPSGEKSKTFEKLLTAYNGDEVSAMKVYEHLFTKEFIEEFGDWCSITNTEGLTDDEIKKLDEENQEKLQKAIVNDLGEPALFFVNSVMHKASDASVAATNDADKSIPFRVIVEDGEAKAIVGYDRPVQSGSITFIISNHINYPISDSDSVSIDFDDVLKAYDFNSEGFTEKRLSTFITQSSKDLYYISSQISRANAALKLNYKIINSEEEAIQLLKNRVGTYHLIFDTDEDSPFGRILFIKVPHKDGSAWQIMSPDGIFCDSDRFKISTSMTDKSRTVIDELAQLFFINSSRYEAIKDYIMSNIAVVKPDSYLSSPIVDYENDHFILKPSSSRTQHNVKTELALTYAVYLFNEDLEKFKKYLDIAKLFPEIRQNSAGAGVIKDVNMIGNLIGAIMSGLLIDDNYYTAHGFDSSAVLQAIFVSKNHKEIREVVKSIWKDMASDIKTSRMSFLSSCIFNLYEKYEKINFSNITNNISKNRTTSKLTEDAIYHSFCDSIDKVKALYNYRRTDSGNKKMYDATEYTRIVSAYELLNVLNKQIKKYLVKHDDDDDDVLRGENLERLIGQYFTCVENIINIMDDDISKIEYFIWHTPIKYTPEYYQSLLYIDRSIIGMYENSVNKNIIAALFNLDSNSSDLVQKSLYNIFDQKQLEKFERLRERLSENYKKLSTVRKINGERGSLESIINTMIEDAIQYLCDNWCNDNLKCLTEEEELNYRQSLKADLEGHIKCGMPLSTIIGGSASSGHNIINVLYRIIQTQGKRSNLLIKQKGDSLLKLFKETFDNHNPFNECKQFCEMVEVKDNLTGRIKKVASGYFIRDVNYGQYYRAKVAKQRELLKKLPDCYTIDEDKSTATKLVIEWGVGSEKYLNQFLDDMDIWIELNANRRYNAQYYIKRREILCKDRDGIVVGNEAINRLNTLRRQIDGIKNRYRDKESGVFLPFKVPPVQKKILDNLEHQLLDLTSPYERYTDEDGNMAIREKKGLDLAIALNIRDWNKFIQDKRDYTQDTERYDKVANDLHDRIGKDLTKEDYDAFVEYYHTTRAKQEYYDAVEENYKGTYGDYEDDINEIRFKRRSILARVKHGPKGLLQMPNLDELSDAEWEELKQLDIKESDYKDKAYDPFNVTVSDISERMAVPFNDEMSFIKKHKDEGRLHTYIDKHGEERVLSVYKISIPQDKELIEYDVLTGEFSNESSEYANPDFDPKNSSYEQPKEYDAHGKKLYKNDKYDEIKKNDKLFKLYEEFLNIMKEANEMFGYAAISSNYKLPLIYEREASIYLGRGCNVVDSFYYKLKRSFLIDERDFDRSYTSDIHADNTTSGKLRKRFVDMLKDPEHISTDLVYSVMAYYMTACRYSDKQDVLAQCELINRKILALDDSSKWLKSQASNTVEAFLFENTMNTSSSAIAFAERFLEHTTAVLLKSKLKTALKAFIDGYRLLTNVMLANKWNMRGHFLTSIRRATAQTFSSIRSSIDVLDYDLSEALMSLNNINIQSFLDSNKSKFTRAYFKSGLMPALTVIDHITTKSIMLSVYDSIRLYTNPKDGTMQFLNIDEFIETYRRQHPELNKRVAKKLAKKLFWNEKTTLYDAYQLGEHDKDGKIIKGTENILNIKPEYRNMFSKDEKKNAELWAIIQTRVEGLIDLMAATINGYKPEDTKSSTVMRTWYLKPVFLIRSFLVANFADLFKNSTTLKHMVPDLSTRNTNEYVLLAQHSENSTTEMLNRMWSTDNGIIQFLNRISSEREMYNVLTGMKEVGHYFGVMSIIRKLLENLIIYIGTLYQTHFNHKKLEYDFRDITKAEMTSVINMFIVIAEALAFYNVGVFIGGLLTCLLGQGSDPDDEDEYFVHWLLWLAYDMCGSMINDTLISLPTGDAVIDIFRNIMAFVPVMQQVKQSFLNLGDASAFVDALLGVEDSEVFLDPEYGTDDSPFNLIKSGKWQGEMYGKRRFYEVAQNAPWLLGFTAPGFWKIAAVPATLYLPHLPLVNLKESFSASAAKAKASYTFNNLSPVDYVKLGTPSSSDESYEKFHNYGKWSKGSKLLYDLIGGYEGEEEILEFIRDLSRNPNSPVPNISPVDKVERMIPLGREYDED